MNTTTRHQADGTIKAILQEGPLSAVELAQRVAKRTKLRRKDVAARIEHLFLAGVLRVTDWFDVLELVPDLECTVCRCTQERACAPGCSWAHRAGEVPFCSECDAFEQEIVVHLVERFPIPDTRADLFKRFGDHEQAEGNEALFDRALAHAVARGLLSRVAEAVPYTVPESAWTRTRPKKKPSRQRTAGARP